MKRASGAIRRALAGRSALWRELRLAGIWVTTTPGGTRAFERAGDLPNEATALEKRGFSPRSVEALARALEKGPPGHPCVIDFARALELMARQRLAPEAAMLRARVRYQGTDGVRGPASGLPAGLTPLEALLAEDLFTPELAGLLARAVALWAGADRKTSVVIAQDGRDTSGAYPAAVAAAFRSLHCRVHDLGVAPTPLVPVAMATLGAGLGASITASHNPANQNGIKFFVNGRKLLPEPDEYAVSAFAFSECLLGAWRRLRPGRSPAGRKSAYPILRRCFHAAVPDRELKLLRRAEFIVDAANGAFSPYAERLLKHLRLKCECLGSRMTGENINRGSGVANIEGRSSIPGSAAGSEIPVVGRVRERSRSTDRPVFGIVLDGDGDRGLILVHDRERDEVRIIDGDRLGYLLAHAWADRPGSRGRVFAGTVESDLAVFDAVARFGVETAITPVGDKWLSSDPAMAERLLVGAESSGHVVWPVEIPSGRGNSTVVVAGNGLLTGLLGAAAILRLGLSPAQAAEPFAPGVRRTFYTYFVERPRFHAGGAVWSADLKCARRALAESVARGDLPRSSRLVERPLAKDVDTLHLCIERSGARGVEILGAVFARNSGTENKIATYARGGAEHERGLAALAEALNANHIAMMKDERLPEARAAEAIASALRKSGSMSREDAAAAAARHGITGGANVEALIYALAKEGRAKLAGETFMRSSG